MPRSAAANAEARAKTRAALLEAGAALLRKTPADELLSQVTVREVAREAGVSPAAIYHYWPTQEAFRQAVVAYILDPRRFRSHGELSRTLGEIAAESERTGRTSIRGAARVGARANIDQVLESQSLRLSPRPRRLQLIQPKPSSPTSPTTTPANIIAKRAARMAR